MRSLPPSAPLFIHSIFISRHLALFTAPLRYFFSSGCPAFAILPSWCRSVDSFLANYYLISCALMRGPSSAAASVAAAAAVAALCGLRLVTLAFTYRPVRNMMRDLIEGLVTAARYKGFIDPWLTLSRTASFYRVLPMCSTWRGGG